MKEGASIGGALGALIGMVIQLNIPSGEDVIITGLAAFDITKVAAHNFETYFASVMLTLVLAAFMTAIGAILGAITQMLVGAISCSSNGF